MWATNELGQRNLKALEDKESITDKGAGTEVYDVT